MAAVKAQRPASPLQAHPTSGAVLVGTDTGECIVFDSRSGQQAWATSTGERINAAAIVPGPDVRSVVTVHEEGTMRLLDLRRSASAAELAEVQIGHRLSSVVTDGCCALAGCAAGGVVVWDLDPASGEGTAGGSSSEIASVGAGSAVLVAVGGAADEAEVLGVSVGQLQDGQWWLAAGHAGGTLGRARLEARDEDVEFR